MKHTALQTCALLAMTVTVAHAQSSVRPVVPATVSLTVRPDSRLWIEGSSNLRDWSCEATALDASVDVADARASRDPYNGMTQLRRVRVRVPVSALKCGRSQMDRIMYKALRADDEPECRQIVGTFDVVENDSDGEFSLRTLGTLRVAGRENAVRLDVNVEQLPNGTFRAQGALPILMTDYGITPPTALLGVIRTENRIVVKFDLRVDHATTIAATASRRD
jgi:polyisoprenoid-binding protein YceI